MENKEVFDWKAELAKLKEMLAAENARHTAEVARLNEQAKKVIELGGKDAEQTWNEFAGEVETIWCKFKKWCNWSKWWPLYVFGALVIIGLVQHYIFGH